MQSMSWHFGTRKRRATDQEVRSLYLLCDESGQALSQDKMRSRFDKAREAAAAKAESEGNRDVAARLRAIQFRDLRAKAGTDKAEESGDIREAQKQLGHTTVGMTEHYTRHRKGDRVTPTK